jgi:hypothetical protein
MQILACLIHTQCIFVHLYQNIFWILDLIGSNAGQFPGKHWDNDQILVKIVDVAAASTKGIHFEDFDSVLIMNKCITD